MRIIAGSLKGRRLQTPTWDGLRPTSDKLRETLFNVLASRVSGAAVLDGYAGTGAIGLEALSRGAASVAFVEEDSRAVRLIETNLQRCAVSDRYAIIRATFTDAPARLRGRTYDIVIVDPPYGVREMTVAVEAAVPLMASGGVLVLEHAARDEAPAAGAPLTRTRRIVSGDSALTFYGMLSNVDPGT